MDFLEKLLSEKNIHLNEIQRHQFQLYYEMLIEWNKKMNLTAITQPKEVIIKHFFDSLTPCFYFSVQKAQTLCDVGSGAGFPGIPMKILFPTLRLTIVDSLQKRLTFLQAVVEKLGLNYVTLCHDRAETFARKSGIRENFDLVTARAVAKLAVLSEYCLPLVHLGGMFVALKGSNAEDEVQQAENAIKQLGGQISRVVSLDLPDNNGKRFLVRIDKISSTAKKYPRKPGIPMKDPL
ncbi:16S rRNA (guanine(527)-N(7))-methyltransferase RsmG [Sporolactobacillus shoreicorticis]|uniref:Ribosomal RNA small subunit methyltransferase G n=1 Tax=Sporolactobacillus shoreicorticis TaxID=1923877 RepID=A0ABW5S8D9_9BACL|nr:16S rRNA (guanine(527)-N(7))-methyltransferase RsmG [Sporolactobacillus shoreicorticis]MCO7126095.1 16S rRNA (guanine(527)-N(7))-methyltransferase RsmG [Sporolactobacillus shoreicorticis]